MKVLLLAIWGFAKTDNKLDNTVHEKSSSLFTIQITRYSRKGT